MYIHIIMPIDMLELNKEVEELHTLAGIAVHELRTLTGGANKASAPRGRKALQELKTLAHKLRKDSLDYVKQLPKKEVTKKTVAKLPDKEPEEKKAEPLEQPTPKPVTSDVQPATVKAPKRKATPRKRVTLSKTAEIVTSATTV